LTESLESLQRLAIGIEYDGTAYSGWQYQPHAPSIQQCLNKSISVIAATTIECVGAGRTDAGVHATGQVAHFDSPVTRAAREWLLGINSNLPDDICVLWVQPVGQAFHARFSALKRTYRYSILNQPVRSALSRDRAWWVRQPLDTEAMQAAGNYLLGTHDFSAFRASSCQANTPVRTMGQFTVSQSGAEVTVECSANAFLHHMVRNIVGSLVKVGLGEAAPEWVAELIDSRDRKLSGITAPACGLALTRVEYPSEQLQVIEFKF
jgi:tRNA pseudouridine38-40 synthase